MPSTKWKRLDTSYYLKLCFDYPPHKNSLEKKNIREQQTRNKQERGCINHIFTLHQYMEHRNTFCHPLITYFLELKALRT